MRYDLDTTHQIIQDYKLGKSTEQIALELDVPQRSVIAKLSSLGVYKKKQYLSKRGEIPIKKEEYLERIAKLLDCNLELIESLEKANKNVLILLERALTRD